MLRGDFLSLVNSPYPSEEKWVMWQYDVPLDAGDENFYADSTGYCCLAV